MERGWGGLEICHVFIDSIVSKEHLLSILIDEGWMGGGCL